MQNLETVWHPIVCPDSMGNFKTLEINKCRKIENVCPLYMQRALTSLETLTITKCNSVKEIFQLGISDEEEDTTQLKNITLLRLPLLKQIWSGDPQTSLRFCNLKVVRVEFCHALEHLLPFSTAMGLRQLEQITVKNARKMKEIISDKEGHLDCPPNFEFSHMSSLVLWSLPKLQGFFLKNHSLTCPLLKTLDVRNCLKWNLLKKQGTTGKGKVPNRNLHVTTQQPSFPLTEVIYNLEMLALNYEDASVIVQGNFLGEQLCKLNRIVLSNFEDEEAIFPCWFLQNIRSLEKMTVERSSFKEIFQHEQQNGTQTRIKKLWLKFLDELLEIFKEGFQIDPVLEVLEYLSIVHCSKLKHLAPSSVGLGHLTYLEVINCKGMMYLITSLTARSLAMLTTLKIRECDSVEEIVAKEEAESMNELVFNCLEVLELESLPKLKLFSSSNCFLRFPWLKNVVIRQCPRMKSFSKRDAIAPKLHKIMTDKQDVKGWWEGDLNRTVDKLFQDMVCFLFRKSI